MEKWMTSFSSHILRLRRLLAVGPGVTGQAFFQFKPRSKWCQQHSPRLWQRSTWAEPRWAETFVSLPGGLSVDSVQGHSRVRKSTSQCLPGFIPKPFGQLIHSS